MEVFKNRADVALRTWFSRHGSNDQMILIILQIFFNLNSSLTKQSLKSKPLTWTPIRAPLLLCSSTLIWHFRPSCRAPRAYREIRILLHLPSTNFQKGNILKVSLILHCRFPSNPPVCPQNKNALARWPTDGILFVLVIHITLQTTSHSFLVLPKKGVTLTLKSPKEKKENSKETQNTQQFGVMNGNQDQYINYSKFVCRYYTNTRDLSFTRWHRAALVLTHESNINKREVKQFADWIVERCIP